MILIVLRLATRSAFAQTNWDPRFARLSRFLPRGGRPHPAAEGRSVRRDMDKPRPASGIRSVKVAVDARERLALVVEQGSVVGREFNGAIEPAE
jgi:hypothetical protein